MVENFNLSVAKKITYKILLDGYPIIYPPVLSWDRISSNCVLASWKNLIKTVEDDGSFKFSLYIHIPFCSAKCLFCNCLSFPMKKSKEIDKYLEVLEKEAKRYSNIFSNVKFDSLYIGGGTPSLLNVEQLERLFKIISENFAFKNGSPRAIDSHPSSLNLEKLKILKKNKISRITLGVQTLDEALLKMHNRYQDERQVIKIYKEARRIGIKFINIDLMAGLSGQTEESFRNTLVKVLKLKPDIIHVNPFSPNKITPFLKQEKSYSKIELARCRRMIEINNKIMDEFTKYKNIGRAKTTTSEDAINPQIELFESPEFKASILGLGHGAVSYAYAKSCYIKSEGEKMDGLLINKNEEMRHYAFKFLRQGISKNTFYRLFDKRFDEVFNDEINYLEKKKVVINDERKIVFSESMDTEKYFIYSKIFYSASVYNTLKKIVGKEKNITYNYYI
jgi:oxygen-independent coproporphyrinogen-3 oxidase